MSPTVYYKFTGNLNDAYNSSYDATNLSPGTNSFTTDAVVEGGQALSVSSASISAASSSAYNSSGTTGVSFSFWVKPNSFSSDTAIASTFDNGTKKGWSLSYIKEGADYSLYLYVPPYEPNSGIVSKKNVLQTGVWQHVLVRFENPDGGASTREIYVNGQNVTDYARFNSSSSAAIQDINNTLQITHKDLGYFYNGYLDDFAFWNKFLSDSEKNYILNSLGISD